MERILLVDDEPSNLSMVRRLLRGRSYELDFALSGEEALEKVKKFTPDLVILDIMMPGMDGYEVCRRIKENPDTAGIMVLLLSVRSRLSDRLKGYSENSDDFLAKPFDDQELLARITILLRLKSAIDQAHDAEKKKADFLATMSHEIRTPMGGMIGMLELLELTKLSDEQKDFVHSIRSSSDALLSLINGILDYSKIEAGKIELDASDFNLMTVLDDLNDVLAVPAAKKTLDYTCIVDHTVPVKLCGDAGRLRQILLNLGGNAIKFTLSGYVCIRVALDQDDGDDVVLTFKVEDSGIGIPRKALPRLFNSYAQAGKDISEKFGGTGLGLTISRQLAELMGGDIQVESTEGKGSVFTARVRLTRQNVSELTQPPLRGLKILYADPSEIGCQALTELCMRWGCDLKTVADGSSVRSALDQARDRRMPYRAVLWADELGHGDGTQDFCPVEKYSETRFARVVPYDVRIRQTPDPGLFHISLYRPLKMGKLREWLTRINGDGEPEQKNPVDMADRQTLSAQGPYVLLVDDNEISLNVTQRILNKLGCRVFIAVNGKEALNAFKREVFDLIFMDCWMPEMNGLEATRKIRQMEHHIDTGNSSHIKPKRTPIIALTGNALADEREAFMAEGIDDYITKPVTIRILEDIICRNTPKT